MNGRGFIEGLCVVVTLNMTRHCLHSYTLSASLTPSQLLIGLTHTQTQTRINMDARLHTQTQTQTHTHTHPATHRDIDTAVRIIQARTHINMGVRLHTQTQTHNTTPTTQPHHTH